ncbi:MAG: hypothetical protein PHF00_08820 [Elusimicrobia bacterium]|nr:hypothetical protein [Elusimicrobiota bacterium]
MRPVGPAASRRSKPQATAREIVEQALHLKSGHENWLAFMSLVRKEYPYCTMYGIHVAGGAIVSCENVQVSLVFDDQAAAAPAPEQFDRKWQLLEAFCTRMGSGRLAELKFGDAKPMAARTDEGARRFMRFKEKEPAPGQR